MRPRFPLALIAALALAACAGLSSGNIAARHHGTLSELTTFRMLDARVGWTYNSNLVARTSDGARTFIDVTPPGVTGTIQVDGAFFLDSTRAWVWVAGKNGSSPAILERTTDGGATWKPTGFRTAQDGSVMFFDSDHGWMVTGQSISNHTAFENTLWRTANGGQTWTLVFRQSWKIPIQPHVQRGDCSMGDITWTSVSHGIAGVQCPFDSPPAVGETDDGGNTWTQQPLPQLPALPGVALFSAAGDVTDLGDGQLATVVSRCVGPDGMSCHDYGELYRSKDGGRTWSQGAVIWGIGLVQMPDSEHAFAPDGCLTDQCDGPKMLVTSDGGMSWRQLGLPQALWPNMHAARLYQFVSPTIGFAVALSAGVGIGPAPAPTFFKTTDGGHTFTAFVPTLE